MVKIVPKSQRKEGVTVERMFNGGEHGRAGLQIGLRKQYGAEKSKNDRDPVSKDNVYISKEQGIEQQKMPPAIPPA